MTTRTGVLASSPLTHVIASVRFAPWPRLAKQIDDIQDSMREIAPLMNAIQLEQVGPDGQALGKPHQAWVLVAPDHSFAIQFAQDQVLLIASKYNRFVDFSSKFERALSTLLEHMRFVDVLNIGVRYIDRIKAGEGESLSDYISASFLPPAVDGHDAVGGHIIAEYLKGDNTRLRVNSMSMPNALPVPQDVIGLLMMTSATNKPIQLDSLKPNELVLDMDAILINPAPARMSLSDVMSQLDRLHNVANDFFRHEGVCTEHAFKVWKGE
ncbi:TIGR04255 family protein [Pseudomonas sp. BN102]|uniref:TIGR04255 family protein n=1 Tax=Pseudomonas sp. BN102 TaxID=2567886 RepID=UPI0024555BA5|nr:TIGR04255 family protein [Pseudomonas sp. BN102]MDH4610307.1 TIGR04255 family protein [Pseudomonas sp. BN102]